MKEDIDIGNRVVYGLAFVTGLFFAFSFGYFTGFEYGKPKGRRDAEMRLSEDGSGSFVVDPKTGEVRFQLKAGK